MRAPRGFRTVKDPAYRVAKGDLVYPREEMGDFGEWGPARVYIGRRVDSLPDYQIATSAPRVAGSEEGGAA